MRTSSGADRRAGAERRNGRFMRPFFLPLFSSLFSLVHAPAHGGVR